MLKEVYGAENRPEALRRLEAVYPRMVTTVVG